MMERATEAQAEQLRSGVVADGHERLLGDEEVQAEIHRCSEVIRRKYEPELASSSWLGRFSIHRRMRREVRAAVERIASRQSLY